MIGTGLYDTVTFKKHENDRPRSQFTYLNSYNMMIISGIGSALEGDIEATALAEALVLASGTSAFDSKNNEKIYGWLENMPKNSLCYELAVALRDLGYSIHRNAERL
jgi:hypothetical protein